MQERKNIIMLGFSIFAVILSLAIHLLHRNVGWFNEYLWMSPFHSTQADVSTWMVNGLMLIPLILLIAVIVIFIKNKVHVSIPWLISLLLTFSSISSIAGGDGMVEYHFSIFMVLAALAYYENISLIIVSTIIFAIQHLVGYFTFPELICGTDNYPFSLLMIHALYLIFTSAVIIVQLTARKRYVTQVEII